MTDEFNDIVTNFFKNDYRERGKVKWHGYFLSDHTSSLKQEAHQRHHVTNKLMRMPLPEIKSLLQYATLHYEVVIIQEDYADQTNQMLSNIVGLVAGFSDRGIMIAGEHILFENIRAVRLKHDDN
ncbi:hypothetical protein [Leuconostoc rapi]|uniref:hypothetical protein n=1 Tax=Leuconostoc rapi TaxID=1406906 RepID=UPI001958DCCD|nr:hypothetical protein [Leuconostoc rapi]